MDVTPINVAVPDVNFWKALAIYYNHPNSINKQVLYQEDVIGLNLQSSLNQFECLHLYNELFAKLSEDSLVDYISNNTGFKIVQSEIISDVFEKNSGMFLLIRRLVPKLYKDDNVKFYEFIFLDKSCTNAYIFTGSTAGDCGTKSEKQDPFVVLKFDLIRLTWNCDSIKLSYNKSLNEKGINWIKVTFVGKFSKLLLNGKNGEKTSKGYRKLEFENQVDVVEYYKLYEKLKEKYAKALIEVMIKQNLTEIYKTMQLIVISMVERIFQNWTETTDPKKFVYEDIGIASYLILLWSRREISGEEGKKQRFVDLGCGNGLLVHILNSEGHRGVGLDTRRRKIWDTYPSTTVLKQETIIPTTETTYPDADWLIGNHSDELTAWLPIMARRSNPHCQYFVLPCCPYQLNGKKFQRKNTGFSSYQDFVHYVKNISELCQFETHVDKLRIPSTKRICLVGLNKNEMAGEQSCDDVYKRIVDFVVEECTNGENLDFKPRESKEPVRNCTKVPYNVREEILKTVTNNLLKENVVHRVIKDGRIHFWNRGGRSAIGDLAELIDESLLKQLKSECKGLQTLLKNHHFLFEISQGLVQFRAPENMMEICQKVRNDVTKWKRKNCWLFCNHPDGCPLTDDSCSYAHVK